MRPSRPAPASFRDRTNEFRSAVESARRHAAPYPAASSASGSGGGPLDDSRAAASAQSEFKSRASRIGLGIHQTSQKLARLAKCTNHPLLLFLFITVARSCLRRHRLAELLVSAPPSPFFCELVVSPFVLLDWDLGMRVA
jgi:hypothetical protein